MSEEQNEILANINRLYNARKNFIKFFNGYTIIKCETRYKTMKKEGLKIFTSKQIFKDYQ